MLLFILLLLFFTFLLAIFFFILYYTFRGAPWVPVPGRTVKKMLEIAEVGPEDLVYDLGSGDGRIVIQAARDFEAKAVGIEWVPILCLFSKIRVFFLGLKNKVKIRRANFFETDISKATVVSCYLLPETMEKLKPKFVNQLKPGSRIVSYCFAIKNWQSEKVYRASPKALPIYLYKIKEEASPHLR